MARRTHSLGMAVKSVGGTVAIGTGSGRRISTFEAMNLGFGPFSWTNLEGWFGDMNSGNVSNGI